MSMVSGSIAADLEWTGYISPDHFDTFDMDISDNYPTSGKVVIEGDNGTSITYTVVPNGIEVSGNGGTAERYTRTEVENM